jgi:hypothetical protein
VVDYPACPHPNWEGDSVVDYIAFARIQAVRSGDRLEMSIGPPSSLEPFPNLASFGSSLLLKEHFSAVDGSLAAKRDWRSWMLFLTVPPKDPKADPEEPSIDAKLISGPVTVTIDPENNGDRLLRTVTSAFEKRQTVVLKVNKGADPSYRLTDVELILES